MNTKKFRLLYLSSVATWFVGVSIMPLLPIYAEELGASPAMTGNYLAVSFLLLTLGALSAGRIAQLFRRRRELIMAAGFICLPATWLLGRAANVWQLAALTMLIWFMAGVAVTLQSIVLGLFATPGTRGRLFGMLASTVALAGLIGRLLTGPMVERWGYPQMFAILSLVWIGQIVSSFFLPDQPMPPLPASRGRERPFSALNSTFIGLFSANLLVSIAIAVTTFGMPVVMNAQEMALSTITFVAALQSGLGLVINPAIGSVSDRWGHRSVLLLAFAALALGLLLLASAESVFSFALIGLILAIAATKEMLIQAFTSDNVILEQLDGVMSFMSASQWLGMVVGFVSTGYAVQAVGLAGTFRLAAVLPLIAVGILFWQKSKPMTAHSVNVLLKREV